MNKITLRIIIVSFFLLLSIGSFFVVLAVEEDRRLAKTKIDQEQFLANAREIEKARQAYLESVAESRAASREAMTVAKNQYETLLKNQSALVEQQKKKTVTTVPVQQLVPVASSSNVTKTQTSKPKATATRKTKTS